MNMNALKVFRKAVCFFLGLAVCAITTSQAGPAKIVRQYALTSANDFPQRDPQDWTLLASNDKGQTWVTLDVRKGEVFSERHQRRAFPISNNAAYETYRLQIDRVRDPVTADSVQLSEIELMGPSELDASPTPLFCDLITAQGENPQVETVYQAFDGKVETKWLDSANQFPDRRSSWVQWQYVDHSSLIITNALQLRELRSHANEEYPVRIEAVVAGPVREADRLCLMDATGAIEIATAAGEIEVLPGQRVLLEGTSQWASNQVQVQQPRLQRLGPAAATASGFGRFPMGRD
jgi:hypothetical protein